MKRLLLLIILFNLFHVVSYSQNKSTVKQVAEDKEYYQKMAQVQGCEELNIQLTKMFGKNYTIKDPKVLAQLKKNIADKDASRCIRKKSLYGIYGEDYVNKLDLINDGK